INHIRKIIKLEKNVSEVPSKHGWSPYIAKDFLSEKGFATGYYNKLYDDRWFASSPMVEIGNETTPDDIAYYIEGVEGIAKTLKIKLNVYDSSRSSPSKIILLELADTLIQKSLNMKITEAIKNALLAGKPCHERYGEKSISVDIDLWREQKFNGYDIKLTVSSI
ncbi:MAG: hypothetical protein U1A62_21670, partial [Pseudomonas sp.]|nr:hypothetical protein [Pseudomonas sp.]